MHESEKILLTSRSVLPYYKGGSANVTHSLAQHIGADRAVVAGGRHVFSLNSGKVVVHEVPHYYIPTEIHVNNRGHRYFHWLRWIFIFPILTIRLRQIIRKEKIDFVLGTFPDNIYLLASCLAAKWSGAKFFAYFHNTYVENRRGLNLWVAKYIQQFVFRNARIVFNMSEGMNQFYESKFDNVRFEPLPHTYSKVFQKPSLKEWNEKHNYKLALLGNFNDSNLDATRFLVETLKNKSNIEIHFFTRLRNGVLIEKGIDASHIHNHGYVQDEKVMEALRQCDISVITHGFKGGLSDVEYRTIFPTRIITLMLSGNPLLVLAPKNSFLYDFVKRHNCGVLVTEPNASELERAIELLVKNEAIYTEYSNSAIEALKKFNGGQIVDGLFEKMKSA